MSVLAFWAPNLLKPACFHVGIHQLLFSAGSKEMLLYYTCLWLLVRHRVIQAFLDMFLTLLVSLQQFLLPLFFFLCLDEVEVEACEGHVWLCGRSSRWAHLQWGWRSGGTRRGRCWLVGEYKKKKNNWFEISLKENVRDTKLAQLCWKFNFLGLRSALKFIGH